MHRTTRYQVAISCVLLIVGTSALADSQTAMRIERDLLGEKQVPAEAY